MSLIWQTAVHTTTCSIFDETIKLCYGLLMDVQQLPGPNSVAYASTAIATVTLVASAATTGPLSLILGLAGAAIGIAGTLAAFQINRARARLPRSECRPCGSKEKLEGEHCAMLDDPELPSRRWADSVQRHNEIAASQRWM